MSDERFAGNRVVAAAAIEAVAGRRRGDPAAGAGVAGAAGAAADAVRRVRGRRGGRADRRGLSSPCGSPWGPGPSCGCGPRRRRSRCPGSTGLSRCCGFRSTVAAGGRLEYLPEPVVVAAGARHATLVSVTLAAGASLLLRDEVLLGRHGEAGGTARSVLRVSYAGRPLLRQSLEVSGTDQASLGPAVLAGHRAVGTLLHVGESARRLRSRWRATPEVAVMPLAGPGFLVTALADDAVTLRRRLTTDLSGAPGRVRTGTSVPRSRGCGRGAGRRRGARGCGPGPSGRPRPGWWRCRRRSGCPAFPGLRRRGGP